MPVYSDDRVLVDYRTADDAGGYRIDERRALVQTVDFFTPIVDDPFVYGQIAAANALSDVYAMGGRPLTALNLLGVPVEVVPPRVIHAILRGGATKVKEAECVLLGGHTIRNPEPLYGLSVTGLVDPRRMITNSSARPGDLLVLTKPLGTGIITTGIKRGWPRPSAVRKPVAAMRALNVVGAELAERGLVHGGTDVTGYGLLGHLGSMCRARGVGAEINASQVPVLDEQVYKLIAKNCVPGGSRENLKTAEEFTNWNGVPDAQKILLADAPTSGGLLLCVRPRLLDQVLAILRKRRTPGAAVVGRIVRAATPGILVARA